MRLITIKTSEIDLKLKIIIIEYSSRDIGLLGRLKNKNSQFYEPLKLIDNKGEETY